MARLRKPPIISSNGNRFSFIDFINTPSTNIIFLIGLLIIVSLYDLFSPPISVTIWRQTQTAMLTDNFVREGFSLKGLYVGLKGHDKLMMTYEFPIYNFIVGMFFTLFNNNPFWGKLVSLFSSIITLIVFHRLVKSISNNSIAFVSALLFSVLPLDVLMCTSFQPDALGLMFLVISIFLLNRWRNTLNSELLVAYSLTLLLCGLCKFPILVPYIPVFILMFLFPVGQFRFPKVLELLIIASLFLIPFVWWYLYRAHLTDPLLLAGEYRSFLIGDLGRFLSAGLYIKITIALTMLVFCGTGIVYFFSGLRGISTAELILLIGIPFYYMLVPTVADQYYYLYAVGPIVALFMSKGIHYTHAYFRRHSIVFISYGLCASFIVFILFGINYVMRRDKVIVPASEIMRQVSQPEDLIFVVNMHDRGSSVGGWNSTVAYFTGRNGWNVQDFKPDNYEDVISQIENKRDEGAAWLFVTWFTPDLEPWYSSFLPKQFSRSPKFDSKAIADTLKLRYPEVRGGNNFAILNLAPKANDQNL